MKTNDKILTELNEVIQYFISHKDNEPKTDFCSNVDKLINLQADLANGDDTSHEKCTLPVVVQQSELLFAFCTYLEETTNIKPFIYKDRIVANFKGKL